MRPGLQHSGHHITMEEVISVLHESYVSCPSGKLGLRCWCSLRKRQLGLCLEDQTGLILGCAVRVAPVLQKAKLEVGSVMAKTDLMAGAAAAFPWWVHVLGSCWEGSRTAEENILGESLPPVVLQGSEIHKYL